MSSGAQPRAELVRAYRAQDEQAVRRLLCKSGLPTSDVAKHLQNFLVAGSGSGSGLAGVVGLEYLGESGLLRSLAVEEAERGKGLGRVLCHAMLAHARTRGVRRILLLTTTAADFFTRLGFERVQRDALPPEIRATEEFRTLCPDTAVVMAKNL